MLNSEPKLHGHRTGEHLLCYRAHHAFQDGMASARAFEALFGAQTLAPSSAPSDRPVLTAGTLGRCLPYAAGRLVPTARWQPGSEVVAPPQAGPAASVDRTIATARLDHARLASVAAATGATTAQVLLAVLAGALRAWQPARWRDPRGPRGRGVRIYLSVGLRPRGPECGLGNHATSLPVSSPAPNPPREPGWTVSRHSSPPTGWSGSAATRPPSPTVPLPGATGRPPRQPPAAPRSPGRDHPTPVTGGVLPGPPGLRPPAASPAFAGFLCFVPFPEGTAVTAVLRSTGPPAAQLTTLLSAALEELRADCR